MNPDNIKQSIQAVIDGLTPLAQKLGVPLGQLWEVMVRQNYVYAVYNIMWAILCAVLIYGGWRIIKWLTSEDGYDDIVYLPIIFIVIGMVVLSAMAFSCAQEALGRFINPPYYIVQDISHLIHPPSGS